MSMLDEYANDCLTPSFEENLSVVCENNVVTVGTRNSNVSLFTRISFEPNLTR